jgi:hypothetical protein
MNGNFIPSIRSIPREAEIVHRHDDHDFELIDDDAFMPAPDFEIVARPMKRSKRRYSREEIALEMDRHALSAVDAQDLRNQLEKLLKDKIHQENEGLNSFNLRFIRG